MVPEERYGMLLPRSAPDLAIEKNLNRHPFGSFYSITTVEHANDGSILPFDILQRRVLGRVRDKVILFDRRTPDRCHFFFGRSLVGAISSALPYQSLT
jgi:hypothetical protein